MTGIWHLPGPAVVADRLQRALRDGRVGVLAAPIPTDLDGLARHLAGRRGGEARETGAGLGAPLERLGELLDAPVPDTDALAAIDAGGRLWVVDIPADAVLAWQPVIAEYARSLDGVATSPDPPAFVFVLRGGPAPDHLAPRLDGLAAIEFAWWWAVVRRLDVELHIDRVAPHLSPVRRACIAEVAGFDLRLAAWLTERKLDSTHEWLSALTTYAHDHAFDFERIPQRSFNERERPRALAEAWARGWVDVFCNDPLPHWHSALHALSEERERGKAYPVVRHRVSKGYVRAMLPRLGELAFELAARSHRDAVVDTFVADISRLLVSLKAAAERGDAFAIASRDLAREIAERRNLIAHFAGTKRALHWYEAVDQKAELFFAATGPERVGPAPA